MVIAMALHQLQMSTVQQRGVLQVGGLELGASLVDRLFHGGLDGTDQLGTGFEAGHPAHRLDPDLEAVAQADAGALAAEPLGQQIDDLHRRGMQGLRLQGGGDQFEQDRGMGLVRGDLLPHQRFHPDPAPLHQLQDRPLLGFGAHADRCHHHRHRSSIDQQGIGQQIAVLSALLAGQDQATPLQQRPLRDIGEAGADPASALGPDGRHRERLARQKQAAGDDPRDHAALPGQPLLHQGLGERAVRRARCVVAPVVCPDPVSGRRSCPGTGGVWPVGCAGRLPEAVAPGVPHRWIIRGVDCGSVHYPVTSGGSW